MNTTENIKAGAEAAGSLPVGGRTPQAEKVGVMLVNLGTPDGFDFGSMWRYLREFLSDRRVIEKSPFTWYPILYGIILNTRPSKSGANYRKIWNYELDESPLLTLTRAQGDKLAQALSDLPNVVVDFAMRYGNPSMESVARKLTEQGCTRLVVLPLYPQYSATTTATVNDKLFEALMKMRYMPALRSVPAYYNEPVYIDALARSIETHLATLDFKPEVVLASYHGIPKSYAEKGDPYASHCHETTRLLRERLGWDESRLITTFQSLFGREEWVKPYTDKTTQRLAQEGVKSIAIVNPGFAADCIETLEEIAQEVAGIYKEAGGENFSHIPCLNDSREGMAVIEMLVRRELSGWI